MTPNIDDIRRDDELLDAIGRRQAPRHTDAAGDALRAWVREIDAPDRLPPAGRYARRRRTRARAGVIAAITVGTLSVSGVAAAVSGLPGIGHVAAHMGFVHRSADFGSGAAGPVSTSAATAPPATRSGTRSTTARMPSTGIGLVSSSDPAALPRVLPGAIIRVTSTQQAAPTSSAPGTTQPVRSSSVSPSPSSSSTSPSSTSSAASTSSSRPAPSSSSSSSPPGKPRPTVPPKPTKSPSPSTTGTTTPPSWPPISTPSGSTRSSSSSSPQSSATSDGSSGSGSGR